MKPAINKFWIFTGVILVLAGVRFVSPLAAQQRFDATVSRVRVDVIVTDDEQRFVSDLAADDFRLFEDGVEQQILEVQLVVPPAGEVSTDVPRRAPGIDVGAVSETTTASSDQGAIVFVIDGLNSDRRSRSLFARQWAATLEGVSGPASMRRAAYLVDGLGRLHELAPLSRDPEAMYIAAERVYGKPIRSESVAEEFVQLATMMSSPFDPVSTASLTYQVLTTLCDALAEIPGRKALVWVSTGLSLVERYQPYRGAIETINNDFRRTSRQQSFHEAANTAGVSVYSIDPWLVTWRTGGTAASRAGPVDAIVLEATGDGAIGWDSERDALIQTARATGGRAFTYSGGNIENVLRAVEEDAGRYYILTYATVEPVGDGLYHEIRVEVADPDLEVRARDGYLDLSARERHERALNTVAHRALDLGGLTVRARAYRRWGPSGERVLQVAAKAVDAQGRPDEQWDWFHAVAFDDNERKVGEAHVQVGAADRMGEAQRALLTPRPWPFVFVSNLSTPAGTYRLTVALADEIGGRVGATHLDVAVADDESSWETSDLVLAVYPDGNPSLSRALLEPEVQTGDVVVAYMEVSNGVRPVLSGSLKLRDDPSPPAPLNPVALEQDAAGIHRGALRMRLDLPGTYLLEVTVVDEDLRASRTIATEIVVSEIG